MSGPVAFVLGGGGPLGAYEVGMLKALMEREIHPDLVLGSSVGALNGATIAADPTPRDLAPGRLWRPIHRAIPDSIWLPGAGSGILSAQDAAALAERIETLTQGDRTRPVVTYCHPDCWGSWNLGKRLVTLGYRSVHWFPAGIEGWQERHDTGAIRPDAAWTRALKTGGGP